MNWFRFYNETYRDPKIRRLAREMSCSIAEAVGVWAILLSLASESERRGALMLNSDIPLDLSDLEDATGAPNIKEWLECMQRLGMLTYDNDTWYITNWDKRQFESDSSRERVRRYREKRRGLGMPPSPNYDARKIIERDGSRCVYCGSTENIVVDHMVPIQLGGTDDERNLAAACKRCNSGKAGRTPEMAGYTFINKEAEARYHEYRSAVTVTGVGVTVTVTPPDTETDTEKKYTSSPSAAGAAPLDPADIDFPEPKPRLKHTPDDIRAGVVQAIAAHERHNSKLRDSPWASLSDVRVVHVLDAFSRYTGIPPPRSDKQKKRWIHGARELLDEFDSVELIERLFAAFMKRRKGGDERYQFSITDPHSLVKTLIAMRSEVEHANAEHRSIKPLKWAPAQPKIVDA
ncbi:MAG TPA: hypothetical protein G4O02_16980 [Caldilineae bacterium]|nr:hypothetical protein [Caldilineae bacterium]